MLEINISRKIYYNKSGGTEALKQVYLQVKPGEIIGLFGENGAGKTTLLKSILGFEKQYCQTIFRHLRAFFFFKPYSRSTQRILSDAF